MAHVLIADDDFRLAESLRERIEADGHRVTLVADGDAVFPVVERDRPSAIVLDALIPVMSGHEVLYELKRDPATADIPVIMLTECRGPGDIVAALRAGAADYVTKPFMPDELTWRLSSMLGLDPHQPPSRQSAAA